MRKKFFSLLVLLAAVATGAMAQTESLLTTITATAKEQASYSTANVATVSFSYTAEGSSAYVAIWGWWGYGWSATVNAAEGYTITKCIFYDDANRTATDSEAPFVVETTEEDKTPKVNGTPILADTSKGIKKIEVYGYVTPTTVDVTLADGTDDATSWQGKAGEGEYQALPLSGLEAGTAVSVKYTGSKKVKSVKAVKKAPSSVLVTALTLNKTATTIYKVNGTATETLSVTAVAPDEATDKTYTWSSDNEAAATVDASGVVTAVADGTAHIRATANDGSGVYGECTVTVSDLSAYYSKMVECGCDDLDGKCADGGNPKSPFTGQVLSAAQAIALAQAKAADTGSNCAVFYDNGGRIGEIRFAKNDGTTGSAQFYYTAADKGLSGYRGFYVSK